MVLVAIAAGAAGTGQIMHNTLHPFSSVAAAVVRGFHGGRTEGIFCA